MRLSLIALLVVAVVPVTPAAIRNSQFTATWDLVEPSAVYEFRWRHFASPEWMPLPAQPSNAGTFTSSFAPLPNTPETDRWMCLDARSVREGVSGPWLSATSEGASCADVEVGVIPVPPPPVPVVLPPQPDIFTALTQADGRLSIEYQIGACPRGVQQTTSAVKDGRKTITLTCRR